MADPDDLKSAIQDLRERIELIEGYLLGLSAFGPPGASSKPQNYYSDTNGKVARLVDDD